ncbi:hypothetical protein CathTA2_1118 [Caldalkalibacillus thermarum TA2.A1]|uniref:Hydrolase n=1 Tax=Caldalkalibacillus thermarum (strain TA2.A1) TaxID=986075 RepID=F5L5Q5_CALTT|nr:hypothetical protein [Caldalkalibacillus thermarum]EGL83334.1 hypothetical protein CathTA2_1118 [Caldalkalibacillus thermarum TA2.A1]QZT32845.1 hypothetical protein HUR95_10725 [Caldalkalibacillus thermarum TA2.A1]GGK14487.1 hypothetical protein GCM10010965_04430 [Caldalkalibacillus thermarum]
MTKQRYFVHPKTGEILDEQDPATFAFAIEATEEEMVELRNLFMELLEEESDTFFDAFFPFQQEEAMTDNEQYEQVLNHIYQKIYELGTAETKQQLENMYMIKR